jgi:hypothetical protein
MAYNPDTKPRETRARRAAKRRGLTIAKSPRKDTLAPDFNRWALTRGDGKPLLPGRTGMVLTLEEVEAALHLKPTTRRPRNGDQP